MKKKRSFKRGAVALLITFVVLGVPAEIITGGDASPLAISIVAAVAYFIGDRVADDDFWENAKLTFWAIIVMVWCAILGKLDSIQHILTGKEGHRLDSFESRLVWYEDPDRF